MSLKQFQKVFRDEHRRIRDVLLELSSAFEMQNQKRIRDLLQRTVAYTGPHFRYEEEALYPSLVKVYGEEYIEKLLEDHDGAIRSAFRLAELGKEAILAEQEIREALTLIRQLLPHVSDCEGLSIMVERLPEDDIRRILRARNRARRSGQDLLRWAQSTRERRWPALA